MAKPEVRFVTYSDLIRWMQASGRGPGVRFRLLLLPSLPPLRLPALLQRLAPLPQPATWQHCNVLPLGLLHRPCRPPSRRAPTPAARPPRAPLQDPVPLSQFDDWQQCNVTGVKADLSGAWRSVVELCGWEQSGAQRSTLWSFTPVRHAPPRK